MNLETCFVIMAIGDQSFDGETITADELHQRYNDLIKEALVKARPELEVVRADEVALPGTITTDIIRRLMESTFVIADITYPNPNVFYELGLRHACKPGTFIIRDKKGPIPPFDIAHLRRIEYDYSPSGLKQLSEKFAYWFKHYDRIPDRPDNHFLELAELLHFNFPDYTIKETESDEAKIFMELMKSPDLIDLISRQQAGETVDQSELLKAMGANTQFTKYLISALSKSGQLTLS